MRCRTLHIRNGRVFQRCADDCADTCRHHTWSYAVELPTRNGKRRQVTNGGFTSAKVASDARAELIQKHRDGKVVDDGKLTVAIYLSQWLTRRENDPDDPLRPTTARNYRQHIHDYLSPKLGHMRLKDRRRDHVSEMLKEVVADRQTAIEKADSRRTTSLRPDRQGGPTESARVLKPLSKSTLRRIRAPLGSALGDAVDQGLLSSNPALNIRLRKGKKRAADDQPAPKAWGAPDVARFLDVVTADNHPVAVLFHLAAIHGLRRGELLGLRWPNVDLDNSTLRVEKTRTSAGKKVVEGPTKSDHSKATINLDPATVALLRMWKAQQARLQLYLGEAWEGEDIVFVREDGKPWTPNSVSSLFVHLVKKYEMPKINLHGLRHTSASLQIAAGVPVEVVSKRLRHANVTITSGVYSHLLDDAGSEAANAVANLVERHRKAV